ncbi:MAG: channel protein TolC, partial [Oxalobacteraceae bacterium]
MTEDKPAACRAFRMAGFAVAAGLAVVGPAASETLESALAKAYGGNPQLNASRANVRATWLCDLITREPLGRTFELTEADVGADAGGRAIAGLRDRDA